MKIGIIGRTKMLVDTANLLLNHGYEIPFVYTCKAEQFYNCNENNYKEFADSIDADFYCDSKINSEEKISSLRKYACDVAVTVNWINILKKDICDVFKHGIWNAHSGDLPKYRGNACPNWAIMNNESRIGLSIHEVEPGVFDSGDILLKEYLSINSHTYISEIYSWLEKKIPQMFLKAVNDLKENRLQKHKQSIKQEDILRCYPRKPEDSRIFWNQPAEYIHRIIRASSEPLAGAFCYMESGELVRIWRADLLSHYGKFLAVPGQVLYVEDKCPVVSCKDNILKLTEVTIDNYAGDAEKIITKSLRNRLV